MLKIPKVVVMIPCYNEEQGIGEVLDAIPKDRLMLLGYDVDVLVIDNNSKDRTMEIAESKGAKVIRENRQGKGYAILTGFNSVPEDAGIVVMVDGDNSYDIREIYRLIEPLESNFGDVVVGTRLNGKLSHGSMTNFNRYGNWFFTFLARVGYKTNVTDVCSGFFAWKRHVVDDLANYLESGGFSIEMEMITKMAKMDYQCYSVPISYRFRQGKSSLRPIRDGIKILISWTKNLTWSPDTIPNKKTTAASEFGARDAIHN